MRAIGKGLCGTVTLAWWEVRELGLEAVWRVVIPVGKESKP